MGGKEADHQAVGVYFPSVFAGWQCWSLRIVAAVYVEALQMPEIQLVCNEALMVLA